MNENLQQKIIDFLKELLHPDGYGYAVTQEVRNRAKELLMMTESNSNE